MKAILLLAQFATKVPDSTMVTIVHAPTSWATTGEPSIDLSAVLCFRFEAGDSARRLVRLTISAVGGLGGEQVLAEFAIESLVTPGTYLESQDVSLGDPLPGKFLVRAWIVSELTGDLAEEIARAELTIREPTPKATPSDN